MSQPDERDNTGGTDVNEDLHGAAEEVEEGMQGGGSGDDDAAPTPGGG